jgi:hypothetical protein
MWCVVVRCVQNIDGESFETIRRSWCHVIKLRLRKTDCEYQDCVSWWRLNLSSIMREFIIVYIMFSTYGT